MERMMTSPISVRSSLKVRPARSVARRGGFSLIELLVVIGILAILAGILTPMIVRSQRSAKRLRVAGDLQAISTALEAYRQDFADYPRVLYDPALGNPSDRPNPPTGAQVLCWALIGPAPEQETSAPGNVRLKQDGADGPGFRPRGTVGRKYGPYLQPEKFRIADAGYPGESIYPDDPLLENPNPLRAVLLDVFDRPILYFPGNTAQRAINHDENYVSTTKVSLYDASDNEVYFRRDGEGGSTDSIRRIKVMLGDLNENGRIDPPGEQAASTAPYLLWSAGRDGEFGLESIPTTEGELRNALGRVDDVTNFNLQQE